MAVINAYRCAECDKIVDAWSNDVPSCHNSVMVWSPTPICNNEWGGPRSYIHLRDEPFASRSELNRFAREKGISLAEPSEKVGGARNDMYDGVGKLYSYPGSSKRSNPLADLPRRR